MSSRAASCLLALLLCLLSPAATAATTETDANLVTAVDISDSVSRADTRRQLRALAQAIRSPAFLASVRAGIHGRVGFAMFVWHHGSYPDVVGWRIIDDAADAEAVARDIEARLSVDVEAEARQGVRFYTGRLTDISGAIDHAERLLDAAPFATRRAVINVIGEGTDNVGEPPAPARNRLVAAGATVNGVVFGADPGLTAYYRAEVAGGPGAFVIDGDGGGSVARLMERKFLQDLIALAVP